METSGASESEPKVRPRARGVFWWRAGGCALAFLLSIAAAGAVSGITFPAPGIGLWASAFAMSFSKDSLFSVFATHFGLPTPAPIAFGLSGALPQSWLIRCGLHPLDAYSAMISCWLGIALWGAFRAARLLGVSFWPALGLGVIWVTGPMVRLHMGFAMLSAGFAMLPLYFVAGWVLSRASTPVECVRAGLFFTLTALTAVFTDGYTFMMGVVIWGGIAVWTMFRADAPPWKFRFWNGASLLGALALSYALYRRYMGLSFESQSMDIFRAFGMDVALLVKPAAGWFWFWDAVGYSEPWRVDGKLVGYGDSSLLWASSSLLILALGLAAAFRDGWKGKAPLLAGLMVFGVWMSLGPALKVNLRRSAAEMAAHPAQYSLPPERVPIPTGSAWISEKAPGFNVMRASYRWIALGVFGGWALCALWAGRSRWAGAGLCAVLFLPNIPAGPVADWKRVTGNRTSFQALDSDLIQPLREALPPGSRVAVAPIGNDFLIPYVITAAGLQSYNIAGDKNVKIAQSQWPGPVSRLTSVADPARRTPGMRIPPQRMARPTAAVISAMTETLARRHADALILIFADTNFHAHVWPPNAAELAAFREAQRPFLEHFTADPRFEVKITPFFAVITPAGKAVALAFPEAPKQVE